MTIIKVQTSYTYIALD